MILPCTHKGMKGMNDLGSGRSRSRSSGSGGKREASLPAFVVVLGQIYCAKGFPSFLLCTSLPDRQASQKAFSIIVLLAFEATMVPDVHHHRSSDRPKSSA
ncbi:hypothetical protein H6P81_020491 [Aristolochia fimbriata]|uniref:Uncharacterized protein n=1 Tax=Aristolochia fimbriata TaxID=158543 RepID=A0AAV7DXK9_ARIFI|nr:hypothetical protein H6P81_020491 [Aristolochia fimbriata]